MTSLALLPIFLIGLFGGVHCVGMCGGIVSAFSVATPKRRPFPLPVTTSVATSVAASVTNAVTTTSTPSDGLLSAAADGSLRVIAFNAGRIGSYMVAGALAASLAGSLRTLSQIATFQTAGYWLANLMLIALGASLMNLWHGLSRVEAIGQILWRRIQPLMKHLLPVTSIWQAAALGGLWGWVPCGMVYSVLMTALLTGSPMQGALVMGAFGLGTLPLLLSMGLLGTALQTLLRKPVVRVLAGTLVLSFGVLGLLRVVTGMSHGWLDAVCISPAVL